MLQAPEKKNTKKSVATFHYQLLRRDIFHLEINDTFYVLKTISVIVTSEKRPSAAKMNKKFSTGRLFFPSIYRRKSLTTSSLLFFEKNSTDPRDSTAE